MKITPFNNVLRLFNRSIFCHIMITKRLHKSEDQSYNALLKNFRKAFVGSYESVP